MDDKGSRWHAEHERRSARAIANPKSAIANRLPSLLIHPFSLITFMEGIKPSATGRHGGHEALRYGVIANPKSAIANRLPSLLILPFSLITFMEGIKPS